MIKDYYQQFDPAKRYSQLLFRASKGLQSRELNDLQLQSQHHVKGIADVLMKDGDVVKGARWLLTKLMPLQPLAHPQYICKVRYMMSAPNS
nr:DUF4815 domain-containing protein [Pseudoalteromonas piscicida]